MFILCWEIFIQGIIFKTLFKQSWAVDTGELDLFSVASLAGDLATPLKSETESKINFIFIDAFLFLLTCSYRKWRPPPPCAWRGGRTAYRACCTAAPPPWCCRPAGSSDIAGPPLPATQLTARSEIKLAGRLLYCSGLFDPVSSLLKCKVGTNSLLREFK